MQCPAQSAQVIVGNNYSLGTEAREQSKLDVRAGCYTYNLFILNNNHYTHYCNKKAK